VSDFFFFLISSVIKSISKTISFALFCQDRPNPNHQDPEKFDGHAYKIDTWLPSIKAKLMVDGAMIGDSVAQFHYVYLKYLESPVQAMVIPQLNQAEDSMSWV
jgi:hypothetical protein